MKRFPFLFIISQALICGVLHAHGGNDDRYSSTEIQTSYGVLTEWTPVEQIYFAIAEDNVEFVKQMVSNGVECTDAAKGAPCSIVEFAILSNSYSVVKFFLENGWSCSDKDFILAAFSCEDERIPQIIFNELNQISFYNSEAGQKIVRELISREGAYRSKANEIRANIETYYSIETPDIVIKTEESYRKKADSILSTVRFLINRGMSLSYKDKYGWLLLHHAVEYGSVDMVKLLCELGADVNISAIAGHTPMSLALMSKSNDKVDVLQTYGARKVIFDEKNLSFLIRMCEEEAFSESEVIKILTSTPSLIKSHDCLGYTLLMHAVRCNNERMVKLLLDFDVDVTITIPDFQLICMQHAVGKSALDFAVDLDYVNIVKLLIESGAKINLKTCNVVNVVNWQLISSSLTADDIYIMLESGVELKIIESMLKKGACMDISSTKNLPYGILYEYRHSCDITRFLLQNGANPNASYTDGRTCLMALALSDSNFGEYYLNVAEQWINAGVSINQQDVFGNTALHYSVHINRGWTPHFFDFLISKGASPVIRNNEGRDILAYAVEQAHNHLFRLHIKFYEGQVDATRVENEIQSVIKGIEYISNYCKLE